MCKELGISRHTQRLACAIDNNGSRALQAAYGMMCLCRRNDGFRGCLWLSWSKDGFEMYRALNEEQFKFKCLFS